MYKPIYLPISSEIYSYNLNTIILAGRKLSHIQSKGFLQYTVVSSQLAPNHFTKTTAYAECQFQLSSCHSFHPKREFIPKANTR